MTVHYIDVTGGALAVKLAEGTAEPILAVHGVSSHRRLWTWTEAADPSLRLLKPDLRGRADSFGVTGPSSVVQHSDDLVAVLDALGLERVHVVGMSMGGFVALALAARYPERVRTVTLIDGGLPMTPPPGVTPENLPLAFADRLGRLEKRWESAEAFRDYFVGSTAPLLDPADPLLAAYLEHDLTADGQVRLSGEALVQDAADIFFGDSWASKVTAPVRLLAAEWSVGADSAPAYTDEVLAESPFTTARMAGVDHAAIVMTPRGGVTCAAEIRASLALGAAA